METKNIMYYDGNLLRREAVVRSLESQQLNITSFNLPQNLSLDELEAIKAQVDGETGCVIIGEPDLISADENNVSGGLLAQTLSGLGIPILGLSCGSDPSHRIDHATANVSWDVNSEQLASTTRLLQIVAHRPASL
jgi:hypothetical protein